MFAVYALVLPALAVYPFVAHLRTAYRVFCAHDYASESTSGSGSGSVPVSVRPWCTAVPPSVYTYVQARYWNSGLLLYWTTSQIPNFVLAAPPLVLLFAYSGVYLRRGLVPRLREWARARTYGSAQGQWHTQPEKGAQEHQDKPGADTLHPSPSSSPFALAFAFETFSYLHRVPSVFHLCARSPILIRSRFQSPRPYCSL